MIPAAQLGKGGVGRSVVGPLGRLLGGALALAGTCLLGLPQGLLGPIVMTLTREGWHVEAEGRVYRRPGTMSLRVSSGIDWFDLEAEVDFEGQRVALPRLGTPRRRTARRYRSGTSSLR